MSNDTDEHVICPLCDGVPVGMTDEGMTGLCGYCDGAGVVKNPDYDPPAENDDE